VIAVTDTTLEIQKKFSLMYKELVKTFPQIPDIQYREFAFLFWDKIYMIRHRGFNNAQLFYSELKAGPPQHVYHSAALYYDPANKIMTEKGWFGCDFVVDIDADHMQVPCQETHDYFICSTCDYVSKETITKCPKCEGSIRKQQWLCDLCLEASKKEVIRLVEDFLPDFGFTKDHVKVNFSGHRGYHIHLQDEFLRKMNSNERRQIVDYLTGTNFDPKDCLIYNDSNGYFTGTSIDDPGWKGRVARKFLEILSKCDSIDSFERTYGMYYLENKLKHILFESDARNKLIHQLTTKSRFWVHFDLTKTSWEKIKNFLIAASKCDIDIPVSIDTHRLIRVQGSIHGKTGFVAKPLNYYEMVNFNPLADPVIFSMDEESYMGINISTPICPEIRIKDQIFGPYKKNEKISVPEAVAVFLICKGVAEIS